jgi:hypothetical protein
MPSITKPIPTTTNNNNNNGHGPYTCNHCHEIFERKVELSLHIATLHNSGEFSLFFDKRIKKMIRIFYFRS